MIVLLTRASVRSERRRRYCRNSAVSRLPGRTAFTYARAKGEGSNL